MNSTMFLLIAFTSLQIYGSEQHEKPALTTVKNKPVTILPKISLTKEEMCSLDKNKLRNDLLLNNQGCTVAIKAFLSNEDQTVAHQDIRFTILEAVNNNDIVALKQAVHSLRLKKALLPSIARCFPEDQNHIKNTRFSLIDEKSLDTSFLHAACMASKQFMDVTKQAQYNTQKINTLKFLIKNGINVDAQDKEGNTAMHYAARIHALSNPKCIAILKQIGAANMNIQNMKGETPVLFAAQKMKQPCLSADGHDKNIEVLETLVVHGADLNIKDNTKKTVRTVITSNYIQDSSSHYYHKTEKIMKVLTNLGAKN